MALPEAVFIDTSVFDSQHYNFTATAFSTFLPVAREKALRLVLPAPTEGEILRHIKEFSEAAAGHLENARKESPMLAKWKHFPPIDRLPFLKYELAAAVRKQWVDFSTSLTLVRLGYELVDLKEVMQWYENVRPPFAVGKKRKEFPDAFAVAMLANHSQSWGRAIAVVSNDPDFRSACERYPYLVYFGGLPALTELLLANESTIESIRERVNTEDAQLEAALLDEAKGILFMHARGYYQVLTSDIRGVAISDLRIVAIGHHECTVAITAELDGAHEVHWHFHDTVRDEVYEGDGLVCELSGISGMAKVAFDKSTGAVLSADLVQFDDIIIRLDAEPR